MKQLTYTLPSFWAVYLINDDASGMADDEIKAIDDWMDATKLPAPSDCSEEPDFVHWHDARDVYPYAADCLTYTFLIHEEKPTGDKQAITREEYSAMEFSDSGYGRGEEDFFDEANDFEEEEEEE